MRHGKKINHLGRTATHRKSMLSNMAVSLIRYKRITTTVAKAKALRKYVEPLITKAKNNTTHSRRLVFSYLQDKGSINELFNEVAGKIGDRPGGYTRILKTGFRHGDNAELCIIELVDYNEGYSQTGEETDNKKKRTRRGRRSKSKDTPEKAQKAVEKETAETVGNQEDAKPEVTETGEIAEVQEHTIDPATETIQEEKAEEEAVKTEEIEGRIEDVSEPVKQKDEETAEETQKEESGPVEEQTKEITEEKDKEEKATSGSKEESVDTAGEESEESETKEKKKTAGKDEEENPNNPPD